MYAETPFTGGDPLPSTAWHPEFQDVNNDGFIDLFISKGNVDEQPGYALKDPSNLLIGQPDGTFVEGAEAAGVVSFARGRGAALADLNLDGLLDLVELNYRDRVMVWRNVGAGTASSPAPLGHWVALRLTQPGPNRDAIGAWVEVKVGDLTHAARGDRRRRPRRRPARLDPVRTGAGDLRRGARAVAGRRAGAVAVRRRQTAMSSSIARPVPRGRGSRRRADDVATTTRRARLADIALPAFGMPATEPAIPPDGLRRAAGTAARGDGRSAATTGWSSTPIASTAPTSPG